MRENGGQKWVARTSRPNTLGSGILVDSARVLRFKREGDKVDILVAISLILLAIKPMRAVQDWYSSSNTNGAYRTQVSTTGHTPDGRTTTDLAIQCYPGKNGYLTFLYSVHGAREMKGFGFGDVEGPVCARRQQEADDGYDKNSQRPNQGKGVCDCEAHEP